MLALIPLPGSGYLQALLISHPDSLVCIAEQHVLHAVFFVLSQLPTLSAT